MEAVIFDGKEYVKASVLAEKFRYTPDYLGQLCRGKKVDARLVGRAWYINLESLNQHKDSRYKVSPSQSKVSVESSSAEPTKKPSVNYLSRIDVEPVLKNKTVKIFREKGGTLSEFAVKYEQDEYSLIPKMNKGAVSTSLPVLPADAERLKVQKGLKEFRITDFKVEPLPEVFLSGKVHIEGIPEEIEDVKRVSEDSSDIANKIKTEQESSKNVTPRLVSVRPKGQLKSRGSADIRRVQAGEVLSPASIEHVENLKPLRPAHISLRRDVSSVKKEPLQAAAKKELVISQLDTPEKSPVAEVRQSSAPKIPSPVVVEAFSPKAAQAKKVVESSPQRIGMLLPFTTLLCAFVVSVMLIATELEVTVYGGLYADRLVIQGDNVTAFWGALFR